jgi:hypothetical protein
METSLLSKIEAPKILDLIVSKQTQYYTLWAVYTAVQFTAGGFGSGQSLPLAIALAVLFGVWAFNLGHLGFVLQCVSQLDKLSLALDAAVNNKTKEEYEEAVKKALEGMQEGALFWTFLNQKGYLRSYRLNCFVHFFIDTCASIALLARVTDFQAYVPKVLQATTG